MLFFWFPMISDYLSDCIWPIMHFTDLNPSLVMTYDNLFHCDSLNLVLLLLEVLLKYILGNKVEWRILGYNSDDWNSC